MVKIPSKKQGISDKDAPLADIRKINEMMTVLTDKIPVNIGPWQFTSKFTKYPTARELYLKTTIITEHDLGLDDLPSFFSKYFKVPIRFLLLQNLNYLKR